MASSAAAAVALATSASLARADNAPGITDTGIKIGQTMPYSGPASALGVFGRTQLAYFRRVNDRGGINGRRVELISLDDGYSPPKTLEQTRRLVEEERIAFIFGSLGTPTNAATRSYLNENRIPQLFLATGSSLFADPKRFPWSLVLQPSYQTEGRIYARHILATNPDAKIGALYQNDGFGKDYLSGLRDGLGAAHAGMIVEEASYETSEPTIDSQIVTLQGAGADVLLMFATPKFATQAIRKAFDIGWAPVRYITDTSQTIAGVMKPSGLEKSRGVLSASFTKDPTDPRWTDDPGFRQFSEFIAKYMSPADLTDANAVNAYTFAGAMELVLRRCGADLSRENVMRQATNLEDLELPMLLPGIKVNTAPDDFNAIRKMQLARFNGASWELFGGLVSG